MNASTQRMREFSLALDVPMSNAATPAATACHLTGVSFASDDKASKIKARSMLRMVEQLNSVTLAQLPSRAQPQAVVDCATCHRGMAVPRSLQTTLFEAIDSKGSPPPSQPIESCEVKTRRSAATTSVSGR